MSHGRGVPATDGQSPRPRVPEVHRSQRVPASRPPGPDAGGAGGGEPARRSVSTPRRARRRQPSLRYHRPTGRGARRRAGGAAAPGEGARAEGGAAPPDRPEPAVGSIVAAIMKSGPSDQHSHQVGDGVVHLCLLLPGGRDRKSTRLNSSHGSISYAVFCLKKKNRMYVNILSTLKETNS